MADKRPRNVTSISESTGNGPSNGGNDDRLRAVENGLVRIETKLETELKHLATRAWVLAGVIGGAVLAVGMAMTYIKLFGN